MFGTIVVGVVFVEESRFRNNNLVAYTIRSAVWWSFIIRNLLKGVKTRKIDFYKYRVPEKQHRVQLKNPHIRWRRLLTMTRLMLGSRYR